MQPRNQLGIQTYPQKNKKNNQTTNQRTMQPCNQHRIVTNHKESPKIKIYFSFLFSRHQDKHNQPFSMCIAGIRWMGVRVDFLSALFVDLWPSQASLLLRTQVILIALVYYGIPIWFSYVRRRA